MTDKRNKIIVAILAISTVIMASMTISAILADLIEYYQEYNESAIQMVLTIPPLVGVIFAIAAGPASNKIANKTIVIFGLICGFAGGLIAFLFGEVSIYFLYFSSVLIGINQGVSSTMSMALVSEYFSGDKASTLMGLQSAFLNVGGVVIMFLSGILAGIYWRYSYIIYLIFIPIIAIIIKFLPYDKPIQESNDTGLEKGKLVNTVYFNCTILFLFALLYFVYQSNISVFIADNNLGDARTGGVANTLYYVSGAITGFAYSKIKKVLKNNLIPVGILCSAISLFLVYSVGTLHVVFIGAILVGYAMSSIMPTVTFINSEAVSPVMSATAIAVTNGATNIGMFMSPLVINPLLNLVGKTRVDAKFLFGAIGLFLLFTVTFLGKSKLSVKTKYVE